MKDSGGENNGWKVEKRLKEKCYKLVLRSCEEGQRWSFKLMCGKSLLLLLSFFRCAYCISVVAFSNFMVSCLALLRPDSSHSVTVIASKSNTYLYWEKLVTWDDYMDIFKRSYWHHFAMDSNFHFECGLCDQHIAHQKQTCVYCIFFFFMSDCYCFAPNSNLSSLLSKKKLRKTSMKETLSIYIHRYSQVIIDIYLCYIFSFMLCNVSWASAKCIQ